MDACIGGLIWWACGFGFAFGNVSGGFIGSKYFFAIGLDDPNSSKGYADWFFQYAFACTAATIVSGSLAERVQISTYLVFSLFMTGIIYPVVVAWTWGGGWLSALGFSDFAGSGVVHLTGGVAGLVGAIMIKPRLGRFDEPDSAPMVDSESADVNKRTIEVDKEPGEAQPSSSVNNLNTYDEVASRFDKKEWDINRVHEFVRIYNQKLSEKSLTSHSPQQVVLGTLILWLGWLMFNGGSSNQIVGSSGGDAKLAIVNSIIAPSAAGIFTFLTKRRITGQNQNIRMDFQALTNGILAGLVSITAGCNCVQPWAAFIIGIMGSLTYSFACKLLNKLKIDDPLDAAQVHGACGILGCICVAFFDKNNGILYGASGGGTLLGVQLLGCFCIIVWVGLTSGLFFWYAQKKQILRLSTRNEILGGDLYYFGPTEMEGQIAQYDNIEQVEMVIR